MRRPRYRPRPALGSVMPLPVVYGAVAIAIGAIVVYLWPKQRPYRRRQQ